MVRIIAASMALAFGLGVAAAQPRSHVASTRPALADAEARWRAAEAERDPERAIEPWRAAADAFLAVGDDAAVDPADRATAAESALACVERILDRPPQVRAAAAPVDDPAAPPTPLSEDEARYLRALDLVVALHPGTDLAVAASFAGARLASRHGRFADADAVFREIVAHHPTHATAEYAAELLLDDGNRQGRDDDLVATAERLRADRAFLADKLELARTVERIHLRSRALGAERLERDARASGRRDDFDACGRLYASVAAETRAAGDGAGDEPLYNAGVCYEQAGSADAAVAAYRAVVDAAPRSALALRALGREAVIEAGRGRFERSAEVLEAYVARAVAAPHEADRGQLGRGVEVPAVYVAGAAGAPRESAADRQIVDAANDAISFALAAGALARATRVLAAVERRLSADQALSARAQIVLASAVRGDRETGARARRLAAAAAGAGGPDALYAAGRALALAACRSPGPDGLCPRPRARTLVAAAERALAAAIARAGASAVADHAALLAADLATERVLAARRPSTAQIDAARAAYRALTTDGTAPEVRIAAHARLALLARRGGDAADAAAEARACVARARDAAVGAEWLARCEAELAALDQGDADLLRERLPAPAMAPLELDVEVERR